MIRRRASRGFTLIETLVALALLIALLGTLYLFMRNLLETRRRAAEFAERERAVATLVQSLENDLMTCLVRGTAGGAGIDGTEESLRILHRGVAIRSISGAQQDLFRDLQSTEVRFSAGGRTLEGRRATADGNAAGSFSPFGGTIAKVRFRYYDGNRWLNTFNSISQDALPVAVEVAVWFLPWPGEAPDPAEEEMLAANESDPERLTFDATADPFDEDAVMDTETMLLPPPSPDRVRIIVIPDGGGS